MVLSMECVYSHRRAHKTKHMVNCEERDAFLTNFSSEHDPYAREQFWIVEVFNVSANVDPWCKSLLLAELVVFQFEIVSLLPLARIE